MIRFLLDTNAVSEVMARPSGLVARRLEQLDETRVFTSILVSAELRYGTEKRGSSRLKRQLAGVLSRLPVVGLERPFDEVYAALRIDLSAAGASLDTNDLLIAAHALQLDCTLVTADQAFTRVPGLRVEDWTA